MSMLIQDLVLAILSYLPVKTLLRLRCLSKSLCTEIDSPAFIKAHLNQSLQTRTNHRLVLHACEGGLYAIAVDERLDTSPTEHSYGYPMKFEYFNAHKLDCNLRICGSCNGLLLSCSGYRISIRNPFTRRYNVLPYCPNSAGYHERLDFVLGFGYDPSCNDYKVVQIQRDYFGRSTLIHSPSYNNQLWVFSLASNSWKELPIPYCQDSHETFSGINKEGVFADGFLHWLSHHIILEENQAHKQIVSFDVAKEVFVKAIPSVPVPASSALRRRYGVSLQVLAGRPVLCEAFSAHVQLSHIVKNGESFAWTKLYNLNFSCLSPRESSFCPDEYEFTEIALLEQSKDGNKILLQERSNVFIWYDLKQGTLQETDSFFHFPCMNFQYIKASFCLESLVSPGADRLLWSNFDSKLLI